MDVLLARILKYLNGALFYDDYYKFCCWIIDHYLEMEEDDFTPERIIADTGISRESIDDFVGRLGQGWDWDEFHKKLLYFEEVRLDQIRSRMIGLNTKDLVHDMEKKESDEEMLDYISEICVEIDNAQRIVLIGALYPMCLAVEFQTDMISFGKNVVQFHSFDPNMKFTDKDLIIFISATGRAMNGFMNSRGDLNPKDAKSLLITQNPIYTKDEYKVSDYVLQVPGRYDGINYNYQLMKIFDLLRLHYYQQYYLK